MPQKSHQDTELLRPEPAILTLPIPETVQLQPAKVYSSTVQGRLKPNSQALHLEALHP